MRQSAKRLISMIISLVMIIVAFVIFFNFTQPIYGEIQSTKSAQAAKQAFVDSKKEAIKQVQTLLKTFSEDADLQAAQARVQIALPDNPDLSGALAQISGLAGLYSLNIQSINIVDAPSARNQISGGLSKSQNIFDKPYSQIAFSINFIGPYEGFKNFLKKIENNVRIFDVIETSVNSQVKLPPSIYSYTLKIATYYQTFPSIPKTAVAPTSTQPQTQF